MDGPPFSLLQRFEFSGSLFDLELDQFWADLNFHRKRNIRASGQFVVSDRFGFPPSQPTPTMTPCPQRMAKKTSQSISRRRPNLTRSGQTRSHARVASRTRDGRLPIAVQSAAEGDWGQCLRCESNGSSVSQQSA